MLQELTNRRGDRQDHSIPVAPFAGAALAAVNDYRRRRWEAQFPGAADEGARASAAKSFAMSLGVTAGLTGLAAGEPCSPRLLAACWSGPARARAPVPATWPPFRSSAAPSTG